MQQHLPYLLAGICLLFTPNTLCAQANAPTWYRDADADGYGVRADSVRMTLAPLGYAALAGDCNDANPAVNPGVREICNNGVDDNCNGVADEDATPPVAACKPFLEMGIDSSGIRVLKLSDIDNGSYDACSALAMRLSRSQLTCADTGLQVVTLFLQDAAGNTNFCEGRIRIKNQLKFKALCKPSILLYRDAAGTARLQTSQIDARSCGVADTAYLSHSVFTCADSARQQVTLTLRNAAGNQSSCHTAVFLKDTLAPRALCKPGINLFLDTEGAAVLGPEQVDNGSTDACAPVVLSLDKTVFDCKGAGTQIVTLTVRDTSGRRATCTSVVAMRDTTAPRPRCAAGYNLFLNQNGEALLLPSHIDAGSDDACGVAVAAVNRARFSCNDLGSQEVMLSIADLSGNRSACSTYILVRDTIAPKAICREKINLPLDSSGLATLTPGQVDAGSADGCTPDIGLSLSRTSFSCVDLGRQTVTLTVKDAFNNSASCNTVVSVIDVTVPTAQCRQDLILNINQQGEALLHPQDLNNGSADPCGMDSFWVSRSRFTCADAGLQRVILFASDGSGNQSACQATVIIVDPIPPTARCRNDVPVFLDPDGIARVEPRDINLSSNDNCRAVTFSMPRQILTCADTGFQTLRLFVTDGSGNVRWCEATIWVIDTSDTDRDGYTNCTDACPNDPAKNTLTAYYKDADKDGLGAGDPLPACSAPEGMVDNNKDCNDSDAFFLCPNIPPGPIGGGEINSEGVESRNADASRPSFIKRYPNPAFETLVFEWQGEAPGEIALFDLTGRPLKTIVPNGNKTVLNISDLPAGMLVARTRWKNGKTEVGLVRKLN